MGLLDDAIREHLDLKRRRGADPAEVERAEREALGPVRRNPSPGESAPSDELSGLGPAEDDVMFDEPVGVEDEPVFDAPPTPRDEPDFGAAVTGGEASPSVAEGNPLTEQSDPAASAPSGRLRRLGREERDVPGESDWAEQPAVSAPAPADADLSGSRAPHAPHAGEEDPLELDEPTVEHRLEDGGPVDEADGDDVLEETPEFLQDTPDHDRLWFEQRPPRDFDFDG